MADAEARARRAVDLAKGDLAQEADALAMLGRALSAQGRHREALDVTEKLAEASRRIGHETAAEAWGYGVRAAALAALNRYPESMPLSERGIATALRVEGELSPAAISIRLETASSLISSGEARQARPFSEAALRAMRLRGGPSAIAAAARATSYWRHFAAAGVVTYDEAIATIEAAQTFLATQPSAPEYIRKRADFERGTLELVRGNIKEAQRRIPGNAEAIVQSTDSPYEHFASVAQVARLQMNAGEHDRAEASLLERTRLRLLLGAGQHPFRVYDYTSRAANLSMAGRYDEALKALDEAPRLADSADDRQSRTARDSIVRMRARVLADRGDFAAAWQLVEGFELSRPQYNTYNYALAGELQCALGRAPEGARLFQVLLASAAFANEYESSPLLAWIHGNAGVCALAAGDRTAARHHADQARAAFAAQPEVSPYFKRPLARLESALAKSTRP